MEGLTGASDPYLMTNFGQTSVTLSHDSPQPVRFTVEVDFAGDGSWHTYAALEVPPGRSTVHALPDGFAAHWVRFTADHTGKATAWFR